ncbi:MAG: M20/M25/M40 family metallo-hydrolase [Chloroflexota bacterium]
MSAARPSAPIAALTSYVTEHLESTLDELGRLCAQPSVAAQGQGMAGAAELTAALLRAHGLEARLISVEGGFPVVYGEAPGDSPRTLLFYNHYDVQPAEPLELWTSPPFELARRDGRLYARGVGDDKGHIICRLAALDAVRAANGGTLPCRVKFVVEGEEEIGSPHVPAFVEHHRDLLSADACVWEFGGVGYDGEPRMILGMRGILYVELHVRTADLDAHSGLGGSIFPNAAWRLSWALASLKGPDGRIRIPGFYDRVRPVSARDMELLERAPDEAARLKEGYGLRAFLSGLAGVDLRREAVMVPTCTICGLSSGYEGPGQKTVLPATAMAKIDFRLVPDQEPEEIVRALRDHLAAGGFDDVEVRVVGGEHPARVDPDNPFIGEVVAAAREVYGKEPVVSPMSGGSGPMYPFVQHLKLPIGMAGIGDPHGRAHAPDENISVDEFVRGTVHTAHILQRFAARGSMLPT